MAALVFDVETGPMAADKLADLVPKFEPFGDMTPFDPKTVKHGRTSDPAKKAKQIADAEKRHSDTYFERKTKYERECQEFQTAFFERAALAAHTGHVLAIGIRHPEKGPRILGLEEDEAKMLETFWSIYTAALAKKMFMVGFYIFHFDLPFLVQRSWMLGVKVPESVRSWTGYAKWNEIFIDVHDHWQCGRRGEHIKLDLLSRSLGLEGKNGDGASFALLWNTDRNQAVAYLVNDLRCTYECALKLSLPV